MPEVRLEQQTFQCRRYVSTRNWEEVGVNVDPVLWFKQEIDHMLMDLSIKVYGQKVTGIIEYPADWWEAVKRRFFPRWLLRRFPILYKKHDIHALALYPDISLLDYHPVIHILEHVHNYDYRDEEEVTV